MFIGHGNVDVAGVLNLFFLNDSCVERLFGYTWISMLPLKYVIIVITCFGVHKNRYIMIPIKLYNRLLYEIVNVTYAESNMKVVMVNDLAPISTLVTDTLAPISNRIQVLKIPWRYCLNLYIFADKCTGTSFI
jgi:hypothetical protein